MSLSVDGVWKAGVWATTVWAEGVWREGDPPVVVEETPTATAGTGGRRRLFEPREIIAFIDGKLIRFSSIDAFLDAMQAKERVVEKKARAKAQSDARRIVSTGKVKARERAKPPQISVRSENLEAREAIDAAQAKMDRIYWRALAESMAREAEELEDIKFIATVDL